MILFPRCGWLIRPSLPYRLPAPHPGRPKEAGTGSPLRRIQTRLRYIVQNVLNDPHIWGITQIVTIAYGALVVAPVVIGLKFGVRTTVVLYVFEVVLLLALAIAVLAKGGAQGLSATPFHWPGGSGTKDIFIAFSLAVLAFGGVRGGRAAGRGDP